MSYAALFSASVKPRTNLPEPNRVDKLAEGLIIGVQDVVDCEAVFAQFDHGGMSHLILGLAAQH